MGDVALVLSTEGKRGKWILGRISDVLSGKDNHVRLEKVQTGDQEHIRTISKLCPLNANTLRGLINRNLSKKGGMIVMKHKDNEILHKRTYKANEISRAFQN